MSNRRSRRVVFQPRTYLGIQRGINQVADAVTPTLGPTPRLVAISPEFGNSTPDLLDNGGDIAKKIIQISDRDEDIGAMLLRDLLWRLQNQVGDGTATAAVLFQTIFNESVRYLAAGGNSRRLQTHLESGSRLILELLSGMTKELEGKQQLAKLAESISYDPELAKHLGEIFDIIGAFGRLEVRKGRAREHEREYVEGMYWERGLMSREMIADWERLRTEYENAAILISDLDIEGPQQLLPVLELALRNEVRSLIIVANKLSESAIGFLLANKKPEVLHVVAVTTPEYGKEDQAAALQDMAVLTGGRIFRKVTGDTFDKITLEDFGRARRAWANLRTFGVIGGKGDPRALRRHIHTLRAAYTASDKPVAKDKLRKRIGKLLGGSATLWIGGITERQVEQNEALVKRTASAMRAALEEGVIPGGGVALLACRPALMEAARKSEDTDERAAYEILAKAVTVPMRTIIANAGFDASDVMAEVRLAGPGHGFDAVAEQVVDFADTGIYDAAIVLKSAVFGAISTAGLALTVDVIVHHAQPEQAKPLGPTARMKL